MTFAVMIKYTKEPTANQEDRVVISSCVYTGMHRSGRAFSVMEWMLFLMIHLYAGVFLSTRSYRVHLRQKGNLLHLLHLSSW